jgi:endonuclease/exonuclease/phosphatase family metal-dependent hydrolase
MDITTTGEPTAGHAAGGVPGDRIITKVVPGLAAPDPAILAEARRAPLRRHEHDRLVAALPCLHAIEYRPPAPGAARTDAIRVAAWNAERCKYGPQSAALLAHVDADVVLLSELDIGMVRSGNGHTAAALADALAMGYAFGVEYVELDLGDDREKRWHAGQTNAVGLHGNALLGRAPLADLVVIRLDEGGRWFAASETNERRLGWRMAIGGRYGTGRGAVFVVAVHLESSTEARDRARQVETLLAAVETCAGGLPVIIGGDFNTSAMPAADDAPPHWFEAPIAHEPLFGVFRDAGYDWSSANEPRATERTRPDGTPQPPFRRIDWFFTRDVEAQAPRTVPAVDEHGSAISDHDVLVLTARASSQSRNVEERHGRGS